MHFNSFVAASLPVLGALAAPKPQGYSTTTPPSTHPTSPPPITSPSSAFTIISSRSGSSVHLLPVTASGLRLHLGGTTSSYCPSEQVSDCPPGTTTAFGSLCSMDTEVPGGQLIYVAPDGSIGYTQAHSAAQPAGSNACPFTYTRQQGSDIAYIGLDPAKAYGADSMVACPTDDGPYQLFANLANATVPQGDVSKCLGFSALAEDYSGSPAAWQYT